jgi:formylglycine-generating enzyme required for sulfatase activity
VRTILDVDGHLHRVEVPSPLAREIVHLHGYWLRSDTLHTPDQLMAPRPHLAASLRRLLQERTLLVVAYSGWDDIFTSALAEVVADGQANLDVLWGFYESDPLAVAARYARLLERTSEARIRGRFRMYGGVNCNELFTQLLEPYGGPSPAGPVPPDGSKGASSAGNTPLSSLKTCIRDRADALAQIFRYANGPNTLSDIHVEVALTAEARPVTSDKSADDVWAQSKAWRQRWMPTGAAEEAVHALPRQPFRLEEIVELPGGRWILLGDPGSGKTTMLHHLALHLLREPRWLPILLKVTELSMSHTLGATIDRIYGGNLGETAVEEIRSGRAVILLDGLDEVLEPNSARAIVSRVAVEAGTCPVIVASRTIGYQRPVPVFKELSLLPLDKQAQHRLLLRWVGEENRVERALERIRRIPRMRPLAENPLLLTLVGIVMREGQDVPARRSVLYRQAVQMLLTRQFDTLQSQRRLREPNTALEALSWLALRLHGSEGSLYPTSRILAELRDAPQLAHTIGRIWGGHEVFLEEVAHTTGLLVPETASVAGASGYLFPHRTFREYLAAKGLAPDIGRQGLVEVPDSLLQHAAREDRPRGIADSLPGELGRVLTDARERPAIWSEVLALACGLLESDKADALVRCVAAEGRAALVQQVVAEADGTSPETLLAVLGVERGERPWTARWELLRQLPQLVGDPGVAMRLAWRFLQTTRNGNDLWWSRELFRAISRGRSYAPMSNGNTLDVQLEAAECAKRIFDHLDTETRLRAWTKVEPLLQTIPPGRFMMGSLPEEEGRYDDEGELHEIVFDRGFLLMSVPVTNAIYELFDPEHDTDGPSHSRKRDPGKDPVVRVTWWEAAMFAEWLGGRLPNEAEWEYACRAGTKGPYWSGDSATDLARVGWYGENSDGVTHPVALKEANAWGLHDTHGNVFEWCQRLQVPGANEKWGRGLGGQGYQVCRGGSWRVAARNARCANRYGEDPSARMDDIGFRVLFEVKH